MVELNDQSTASSSLNIHKSHHHNLNHNLDSQQIAQVQPKSINQSYYQHNNYLDSNDHLKPQPNYTYNIPIEFKENNHMEPSMNFGQPGVPIQYENHHKHTMYYSNQKDSLQQRSYHPSPSQNVALSLTSKPVLATPYNQNYRIESFHHPITTPPPTATFNQMEGVYGNFEFRDSQKNDPLNRFQRIPPPTSHRNQFNYYSAYPNPNYDYDTSARGYNSQFSSSNFLNGSEHTNIQTEYKTFNNNYYQPNQNINSPINFSRPHYPLPMATPSTAPSKIEASEHYEAYGTFTTSSTDSSIRGRAENWNHQETEVFLQLLQEQKHRLCTLRRHPTFWKEISEEMRNKGIHRSEAKCKNRWKVLVAKYKRFVEKNHKVGNGKMKENLLDGSSNKIEKPRDGSKLAGLESKQSPFAMEFFHEVDRLLSKMYAMDEDGCVKRSTLASIIKEP